MKIKLNKTTFTKYQSLANEICKEFQKQGFACYWAGGAVRDLLSKRENPDIDLATSAKPVEIKKIIKKFGYNFYDIGEKFGTIGAISKLGNIEITTFRSESGYDDFRHPKKVKFLPSVEQDVQRRDFTINGLIFDPITREVFDFVGGIEDLKQKEIRFIGAAEKRIKEDPLRLLRAIRFAGQLGFHIAKKDLWLIKKNAALINKISGQRIKIELDKIFGSENYAHALRLLDETGLLKQLFPEVDNLKRVKQSKDFHAEGNAFVHTMQTMEYAKNFGRTLRYAVFFHDIGKVSTGKIGFRAGREHITFYGHGSESEQMFKAIAQRLFFTHKETKSISYLLKHHMDLLHAEEIKLKTLVKWAKNEDFGDLIKLRMADTEGSLMTDKKGKPIKKDLSGLKKLYLRWQKLRQQIENNLISGNEIMQLTGLKPGPRIGVILQDIKRMQIEGKIKNKNDAKKYLQRLTSKKK